MKKNCLILIPIVILLTIIGLLSTNNLYFVDNLYYKVVMYNKNITNIFKLITNFGDVFVIGAIGILLLIFYKNKKDILNLYLIFIISTILNRGLKILFIRPRPEFKQLVEETGYSFPSGHSMAAMTFYGFIIYLILKSKLNKKIKTISTIILSLLIILIGYSRVYLNVHYISDVIAGFMFSIILLFIYIKVQKSITRKNKIWYNKYTMSSYSWRKTSWIATHFFIEKVSYMKKIGDYVIYSKEVCKVIEIKENNFKNMDYYRLVPIDDESLHLDIPVATESNLFRELINLEQVDKLIKCIPKIELINTDDKNIENEYKKLLNTGNLEDYIKIIKTTYQRNKERLENKRKISDKDNYYLNLAEKYLYNEFSVVLNKNFDETKQYVINNVNKN